MTALNQPNSVAREPDLILLGLAESFSELRELHPNMSMRYVLVFLLAGAYEGKSISELADLASLSLATVSGILSDIGVKKRTGRPGLGLIETVTDPIERRRKHVRVTDKGRALLHQMSLGFGYSHVDRQILGMVSTSSATQMRNQSIPQAMLDGD